MTQLAKYSLGKREDLRSASRCSFKRLDCSTYMQPQLQETDAGRSWDWPGSLTLIGEFQVQRGPVKVR